MNSDEVRALLLRVGLDRLAEDVEEIVRSAIRIQATPLEDGDLPLRVSKLGGKPDLPRVLDWPTWRDVPLTFLAQFQMSDVAHYNKEELLPGHGMLYFFYEAQDQPWGYEPSDSGAWKALYYDGDPDGLASVSQPLSPPLTPRGGHLRPHALSFSTEMTILHSWDLKERYKLTDEGFRKAIEVESEINTIDHQLLGFPCQIQDDMCLWCELCSSGRGFDEAVNQDQQLTEIGLALQKKARADWRLLLQLSQIQTTSTTAQGTPWYVEWGLGGLIYFWIRQDARARRDFSNVWLQLQTTGRRHS